MSLPTNPAMPSWQNNVYPPYNPYSLDPTQILASMQNNALTTNIYESTNKTIGTINDAQRLLTSELAGVNKNIYDSTMQNAIAIERNGANNMATTERVNNQLATAVERTSANNQATTERVNSQLASAVERNGANNAATTERVNGQINGAVERNGGTIMTAIERVAGEGRLTTTITDAASRQASNDSARDILAAVERNGGASVGASKDAYNGLLGAIERNAGEGRMTTITADGASQARLADVRRDITTNLIGMEGELLGAVNKSHSDLITSIGNTAWETRQNQNTHYASLLNEQQKGSAAIALQTSQNYASNLLEGQKNVNYLTSKVDNQFAAMLSKNDGHYASLMLENQKASSLIDNKVDHHYASLLLEQQKSAHFSDSKADNHFAALLSKQDNHFAAILLEQQKAKECLTIQLQEAKYEALKNKQDLSKEMAECCCEIKMKVDQRAQDVIGTVDTLDRNRLRDDLTQTANENSVLKILEWYDDDRGYGRRGHRGSRGRR